MKWLETVKTRLDNTKNAPSKQEKPPVETAPNKDEDYRTLLSRRERDVFNLLVQGIKLKDIAAKLNIAFSTVNSHTKSIYKKLGVNSRSMCIIRYGITGEKDVAHEMVSETRQTDSARR